MTAETTNFDVFEGLDEANTDFGPRDVQLPYLRIVQALSKIMRRSDPTFDPNAKVGLIHQTVTGRLTESIEVVPAKYVRRVSEWKPRSAGGGLVRDHGTNMEFYDSLPDTGTPKRFTSDGHEVVVTSLYFIIDITGGGMSPTMMDFGGMLSKAAKRWNGLISAQEAVIRGVKRPLPMCGRSWRFTTIPDSNEKGEWMTWKPEPGPYTPALSDGLEVLQRAIKFREMAASIALPPPTPAAIENRLAAPLVHDDEIPF